MIISISEFMVEWFGYYNVILLSVVFCLLVILRQAWLRRFDIVFMGMLFAITPALTPFLANLYGFQYFTLMNYRLQTEVNIVAALLVIMIFFFGMMAGSRIPQSEKNNSTIGLSPVNFNFNIVIAILLINIPLLIMFLESGNIINSSYADFKLNDSSPYSSIVNQFFYLCIAFFLISIKDERTRKIAIFFMIFFFVYSIIVSRRNMSVGIAVLILYMMDSSKLRLRHILFGGLVFILLILVGEVRKYGLIDYLQGSSVSSVNIGAAYYSMPGGGANIFLAVIGAIHLNLGGYLSGWEHMPILLWPSGVTESTIYDDSYLVYNGGMHLAAVLYWNFGLVGLALGGGVFGYILRYCENALRHWYRSSEGRLSHAFAIYTLLMLSNTLWYGAIGWVNGTIALVLVYLIAQALPRRKTPA